MPLYILAPMDLKPFAATVSCHQEIAADSAFALAMLARFDDIDAKHSWRYRQRFWEAGMLGQVLYLEAEAAGIQGTGCVFHANWTAVPRQTGHAFHANLDSRSVATRG